MYVKTYLQKELLTSITLYVQSGSAFKEETCRTVGGRNYYGENEFN